MFLRLVVTAGLLATAASAAPRYRFTDLGTLSGDQFSAARAISENGLIAGESGFGAQANRLARFESGTAVEIPRLPGAFTASTRGINNQGVAAAVVQGDIAVNPVADDRAALVTTGGATQLFGASGFAAAGAFDINNGGATVGYSLSSGSIGGLSEGGVPVGNVALGQQRATYWAAGTTEGLLLADPCAVSACNSNAVSIGDNGQIAGMLRSGPGNNALRAVRWSGIGGPADVLTLGAGQVSSRAREINDRGDVAGQVFGGPLAQFGTGAVWRGSDQFLLTMDGFDTTTTRGINNFGTVVGFGQTIDVDTDELGPLTGLIWFFNGSSYDGFLLDSLVDLPAGYTTYAAQAINDAGQIVGFGDTPDGSQHAYLLSMVPEPATWSLLVGGFAMVGSAMRRQRVAA